MFTLLGKSPIDALYYYFIDPLRETWSLHELAIKATPLIMIAVGLSRLLPVQQLEHRRRRPAHHGCDRRFVGSRF